MPVCFLLFALGVLLSCCGGAASAQVIRGAVIDSIDGRPIAGATIERDGVIVARTARDGLFRVTGSGVNATYRVRRIGYVPQDVRAVDGTSLSVRLVPQPTTLVGVTVDAAASTLGATTLTPRTIRQTPALLEPDPFRAIAFLPGIVQASDLRGRLFVAGGRSDEIAIRLDGHPIQSPFHFSELLSSVNVAALDQVDVSVHRLGPTGTGRLSAGIDLVSREAQAAPAYEGTVSLVSASVTAVRPALVRGVDVLASRRVSYIDKLIPALYSDRTIAEVPLYGFSDGLATFAHEWGAVRARLTGFWTRDVVDQLERRTIEGSTPWGWGEWMVGQSVVAPVRWGEATLRASWDRGAANFRAGDEPGATLLDMRSDVGVVHLSTMAPIGRARLTAGIEGTRRVVRNRWDAFDLALFGTLGPRSLDARQQQQRWSYFASGTLPVGAAMQAGADIRLWRVAGASHGAPSAWVRRALGPALDVSASYERRHQFEAEFGEPEIGIGRAPTFLLDLPRVADVAAVAATWTGARQASVTMSAYHKQYRERTSVPTRLSVQGTEEAVVDTGAFPQFRRTTGRSYGVMTGFRVTPARRLLVQGQYTWQRALETLAAEESPTAWDAPHVLSGLMSMDAGRGWTANLAGQFRSGVAVTGVEARLLVPLPDGTIGQRYVFGARNGERLPHYARVDAGARRSWGTRREWTIAAQIQNVMYRQNPTHYSWFGYHCSTDPTCTNLNAPLPFESRALPFVPSIGLEVRW